ncbi:hypothetical protein ABK040_005027 [Willaertia magna]
MLSNNDNNLSASLLTTADADNHNVDSNYNEINEIALMDTTTQDNNAGYYQTTNNNTEPILNNNNNNTNKKGKFKHYLSLFNKYTFGNRRLKVYLLTSIKFFAILYTQANNLFELDKLNTDENFVKAIEIISYFFMALVLLLFTERYIREVYCSHKKIPLNIKVNIIEAILYSLYFLFSCFTCIVHIVFIVKGAQRPVNPWNGQKVTLSTFFTLVNFYIIAEREWVFIKAAKHSVSHYLVKGTAIPHAKKTQ